MKIYVPQLLIMSGPGEYHVDLNPCSTYEKAVKVGREAALKRYGAVDSSYFFSIKTVSTS